jgi:hypothetical protein
MAKVQYRNLDTKVYPPLIAGAPPGAPADEAEPPMTTVRRGAPWWAVLWYIGHISIVGAAYITLLSQPQETLGGPAWQAIPIGSAAALLLWGITLTVRKRARRAGR